MWWNLDCILVGFQGVISECDLKLTLNHSTSGGMMKAALDCNLVDVALHCRFNGFPFSTTLVLDSPRVTAAIKMVKVIRKK